MSVDISKMPPHIWIPKDGDWLDDGGRDADVEYVRADLYEALQSHLAELEALLQEFAPIQPDGTKERMPHKVRRLSLRVAELEAALSITDQNKACTCDICKKPYMSTAGEVGKNICTKCFVELMY